MTSQTIGTRLRRWTSSAPGLGVLFVTTFGVIYAALESLLSGDWSRFIHTAGCFALGGIVTSIVFSLAGAFREDTEAPVPEPGGGDLRAVFHRPSAVANPLIARWRFIEYLVVPDDEPRARIDNGSGMASINQQSGDDRRT